MYLIGVDGGGTKTHCIIGDEHGNVCAEGFGGPANYDCSGKEVTRNSIGTAIQRALDKLNLTMQDIAYASLGLAGADYPEDYEILTELCKPIFGDVPYEIFNDCYIALRAGSEEGWGVISICGTGHGAMGQSRAGDVVALRNMGYDLGNRGGGGELLREAMHHTFRADEGTGPSTRLQVEIPKVFHVNTMTEVDEILRKKGMSDEAKYQIPVLVATLAKQKDMLCQNLMIDMGSVIGKAAAGIIMKMDEEDQQVPLILAGSVFASDNPLLIDAYMLEVHKVAPKAYCKVLNQKPVMGAYYLSLDKISKSR